MVMIKKYTAYCPQLSTSILVDGEVRRIVFSGGHTHPYFKGGSYYSTDEAEQEAIESDSGFGKVFFGDDSDMPEDVVAPVDEGDSAEITSVSDVNDFRSAQKWLMENKGLSYEDVRSKDLVNSQATALGVVFENYE